MTQHLEISFSEISTLIQNARIRAMQNLNLELMNLYWQVGEYISLKVQEAKWGKGVIQQLADYIAKIHPDIKGFSDKNLWRMKQFYDTYASNQKLSALLRQLSWTNNLIILSKTKSLEEKEFYIRLAIKENYSSRELERQIDSSLFERQMTSNQNLISSTAKQTYSNIDQMFRDRYVLDFLNLPEQHSEQTLQRQIIHNLKNFILELGKDFSFIGEEYRIQVGINDYYIDLLFFHRELQCLVAFELKTNEFKPEYLGQINFYLEALDRDIKKPHENPSVGIVLCKTKNDEVVEYALSRHLSPTLIAQYETKLIDKKLLQAKLHELYLFSDENVNH